MSTTDSVTLSKSFNSYFSIKGEDEDALNQTGEKPQDKYEWHNVMLLLLNKLYILFQNGQQVYYLYGINRKTMTINREYLVVYKRPYFLQVIMNYNNQGPCFYRNN